MPGPPPEHPCLRLLKGNPGKRPMRSPPEPARAEQCPESPEHLTGYAREVWIHGPPRRTSCLPALAGRRRRRGVAEGEHCPTGAR
jgi:hypothetical protein